MAIKFNENEIATVTFNASPLSSVLYNGTEVLAIDDLVEYTFPNSQAKLSDSNNDLGFTAFSDTVVDSDHRAYKAFNNVTAFEYRNFFCMSKESEGERLGILFPFDVQIQSITIVDSHHTPLGSSGWLSLLHTGKIYVSQNENEKVFTDELYAEVDRITPLNNVGVTNESTYSSKFSKTNPFRTTHANPEFTKFIRSLCIHGTAWGGNGQSSGSYRTIGEVSINFKAKKSDLQAWASTHNITL